jgi:hypothetical protein
LWAVWDGALDQRSLPPSEYINNQNNNRKQSFEVPIHNQNIFVCASTATQIAEPVFLKKCIRVIPTLGEIKHICEITTLMTSIEASELKVVSNNLFQEAEVYE